KAPEAGFGHHRLAGSGHELLAAEPAAPWRDAARAVGHGAGQTGMGGHQLAAVAVVVQRHRTALCVGVVLECRLAESRADTRYLVIADQTDATALGADNAHAVMRCRHQLAIDHGVSDPAEAAVAEA